MSSIGKAHFRLATQEEVQQAKGGVLRRCASYPWRIACKVMGSIEIYRRGPNILAWRKPYPQELVDRFSYWTGYRHEPLFMTSLFSFFGDRYHLTDKKVIEAFFKHHRNDEIFKNSFSMERIYQILRKTFPEDQLTEDDFMMTCSRSKTSFYRSILHVFMNSGRMKEFTTTIQETVKDSLADWNKRCLQGERINVTQETRLFTSRIITQLMFGSDESSKEIAESINFINAFIIKKIIKKVTPEDEKSFDSSLQVLRERIAHILSKGDIPLFNQDKLLSPAQKKAMIFILFFAGQETTAALLNYMIWRLASNPEEQNRLHYAIKHAQDIPVEIKDFLNDSIKMFPPVYGVGRKLKEDVCLEYRLKGQDKTFKTILFKGQIVTARIIELAKALISGNHSEWYAFGSGCHRCPGEKLAIQEILYFIVGLLSEYKLQTEQTKEISMIGLITSQLAEDIFIELAPRKSVKTQLA